MWWRLRRGRHDPSLYRWHASHNALGTLDPQSLSGKLKALEDPALVAGSPFWANCLSGRHWGARPHPTVSQTASSSDRARGQPTRSKGPSFVSTFAPYFLRLLSHDMIYAECACSSLTCLSVSALWLLATLPSFKARIAWSHPWSTLALTSSWSVGTLQAHNLGRGSDSPERWAKQTENLRRSPFHQICWDLWSSFPTNNSPKLFGPMHVIITLS